MQRLRVGDWPLLKLRRGSLSTEAIGADTASFLSFTTTDAEAGSFGHEKKGDDHDPSVGRILEISGRVGAAPRIAAPAWHRVRRCGTGSVVVRTADGWGARTGPVCKAFCNQCPKSARSQCLAACQGCNGNTSRLRAICGNYVCCGCGTCRCGNHCADLANDFSNCGECGYACRQPGPNEYGARVDGYCEYACVEGAVRCNGTCTSLDWDPDNCGACGNVCDRFNPYCDLGVCNSRGAVCGPWTDFNWDASNCGVCGNVCPWGTACAFGVCAGGGGGDGFGF